MGSSPSRGENRTDDCHKITKRGSSPLTQGKREVHREGCEADGLIPTHAGKKHRAIAEPGSHGLIPAHAGKTSSSHCTKITRRAHPRSHGENFETSSEPYFETGSSPLTRGKR